jgi:O-antigen/teichoic acid export membrane protein
MAQDLEDQSSDKKDIAKGAAANTAGFILRLGARLPFLFIAIALFGNELWGRFIYTTITIELAAAFAVFGFKRSLFKFIHDPDYTPKYTSEEVVLSALSVALIVSLFLSLILYFGAELLGHVAHYPEVIAGLKFAAPLVIIISVIDVLLAATRINRQMRYEILSRSFIEPYVLLIAMLGFYYAGYNSFGLLLAYGCSLAAAFIIAIWGISKVFSVSKIRHSRPSLPLMKELTKFSSSTAFHDLALLFYMRMDVFVVKYFFGEAVLGIYNIAQQIATTVEKIYQSFHPILAPVLAKNLVAKKYTIIEDQMIMVSRWILMIQLLLVLLTGFYGETIITAIAHSATDSALLTAGGIILLFLMIGETINGGFGIADLPLIYLRPKLNPIISLLMIFFYLILAVSVVRYTDMGPAGIAMSLACTYLVMNFIRALLIAKFYQINLLCLRVFKVIAASIIAGGCFYGLIIILPLNIMNGYGSIFGVFSLCLIYGVSLFIFALEKTDKKKLIARISPLNKPLQ